MMLYEGKIPEEGDSVGWKLGLQEGELQKWVKVLGMAVLAGSSLLLEPNAARAAESLADACTEIAGGNGSTLIVIACVVEAVALTGAAVGG
jgi:hypothetical protein